MECAIDFHPLAFVDLNVVDESEWFRLPEGGNALILWNYIGADLLLSLDQRQLQRNAQGVLQLGAADNALVYDFESPFELELYNRVRSARVVHPHEKLLMANSGLKGPLTGLVTDPDFARPLLAASKLKARTVEGNGTLRCIRGNASFSLKF
jgi:hypothetical protein